MKIIFKKCLFLFFISMLSSCLTFRDVSGLGPNPEPVYWIKDINQPKYAAYRDFNECSSNISSTISDNQKGKIIADCMYIKGYKFKAEFGWCMRNHLKNTYICQNKDKYSR
ncbi:hypothetical protein ACERCG_07620 [Mannheimia sp. E30BD]|uniref:hypothetical protein n=1 Tax=Mannheimia sp. E30BD TaxID=3278708 RepID=UPI00359E7CC7